MRAANFRGVDCLLEMKAALVESHDALAAKNGRQRVVNAAPHRDHHVGNLRGIGARAQAMRQWGGNPKVCGTVHQQGLWRDMTGGVRLIETTARQLNAIDGTTATLGHRWGFADGLAPRLRADLTSNAPTLAGLTNAGSLSGTGFSSTVR